MLSPINLNYQFLPRPAEVNDILANRTLPAENRFLVMLPIPVRKLNPANLGESTDLSIWHGHRILPRIPNPFRHNQKIMKEPFSLFP